MAHPHLSQETHSSKGSPRRPCQQRALPLEDLLSNLREEMAAAWARNEPLPAEELLARHPELWNEPEAAADLIYEEICLREEHGESVSAAALLRRFPQWGAELELLRDCQRLFESKAPCRFPAVGELYSEFLLLAELGRGGGGVVFLATQPLLADRPVVLKLTPCVGHEHLRLARLQHTHIVPLYSVQDDPERKIRALCMPYYGGSTLSRLLDTLGCHPPGQRQGRDLLEALDREQANAPLAMPARGPGRQLLERVSYVQALCWIGSCLADAVQYAHERGLVHLDLKPANVLLTAEGQPMLLDFHLAREPLPAGSAAIEGLGGTANYMSPEQQEALTAVYQGQPIPRGLDARSDIYSLGVLLYTALEGPLPLPACPSQSLRRANPGVSAGLADILSRCLAHAPRDRYAAAADLSAELQRHLKDLPLKGVSNRSWLERWQKWRRRRPHVLPLTLTLAIVLAAILAGTIGYFRQQLEQGHVALREGKARLQEHRYDEAVRALDRGLSQTANVPYNDDLKHALQDHLRQAEQARTAKMRTQVALELRLLADRVRLLTLGEALPAKTRRNLEESCRSFWERRTFILSKLKETSPGQTASVHQDLLDLALFWIDLRVSLAPAREKKSAHHEALRALTEVEELFGPSPVLLHGREWHARALGLEAVAHEASRRQSDLTPRTAWDHFALGRFFLEAGNYRRALAHFDRALALQPANLRPTFYKGLCCCRLGDYQDAVVAFSVCIGLAPEAAQCYYNRACAYAAGGQPERALQDYNRALQLEPQLAAAALNRGRLHFQQKRFPEALADMDRALQAGADRAVVYYDRALIHLAQGERAAGAASLRTVLGHDPTHPDALKLLGSLKSNP